MIKSLKFKSEVLESYSDIERSLSHLYKEHAGVAPMFKSDSLRIMTRSVVPCCCLFRIL